MERKLSEEQKKRLEPQIRKASRNRQFQKGKHPRQPPPVVEEYEHDKDQFYPEKGDKIVYGIPSAVPGIDILVEGRVINHAEDQKYFKVLVKNNRKEEKVWIYRQLIRAILEEEDEGFDEDEYSGDYNSEINPNQSYYEPGKRVSGD